MTTSTSDATSNSNTTLANITNLTTIKLDNNNFLNWQHQTLTILKTLGLLQFLNREITPPIEAVARAAWERSDAYVSAFITANLSPDLIHIARGTTSSSDLWQKIEELFNQQVFANQNLYRTQFHSLKQENHTISEYCDAAKNLFDSLHAVGDQISEHALVLQILNGLHPDYQMFVTNIENNDVKPTFTQLRAKLLTHESRLKQNQSQISSTISVAAMAAMNIKPPHHDYAQNSHQLLFVKFVTNLVTRRRTVTTVFHRLISLAVDLVVEAAGAAVVMVVPAGAMAVNGVLMVVNEAIIRMDRGIIQHMLLIIIELGFLKLGNLVLMISLTHESLVLLTITLTTLLDLKMGYMLIIRMVVMVEWA
ncbi:hypothetical protein Hdeb2414_s0009g00313001 [Helianthus debilis subsp. tardiflorus]